MREWEYVPLRAEKNITYKGTEKQSIDPFVFDKYCLMMD
jgi:hypothetical protein